MMLYKEINKKSTRTSVDVEIQLGYRKAFRKHISCKCMTEMRENVIYCLYVLNCQISKNDDNFLQLITIMRC